MPEHPDDPQERVIGEFAGYDPSAERQRREDALRSLVTEQQSDDPSILAQTPLLVKRPKSSSRRVAALVSAVALVAVIGALFAHAVLGGVHGSSDRQTIHRTFLNPTANGLECPHDVSWSPDGSRVAVVGYTSDCPFVSGPHILNQPNNAGILQVGGLVNIYEARTGRLATHFAPDGPIRKLVAVPQAVVTYEQEQEKALGVVIAYFDINYAHVLWSPDGTKIALTFTAFVPTGLPVPDANGEITFPGRLAEGVEVMTVATGAAKVYVHMLRGSAPTFLEWDLQSGALVTPSSSLASSGPQFTVTPAQGYQWGAGGALIPTSPLASSGASTSFSAIGNPDGRASFSLWQPGIASTQITGGRGSVSGVFNWTTDIAAWSPDGRYLAEGIAVSGVVTGPQLVAPDSGSLASVGWSTAPQIPARDAALAEVARISQKQAFPAIVMAKGTSGVAPSGVLLAWRPNGATLAVDAASDDAHVMLLDTTTGKSTLTLQLLANPHLVHGPAEQSEANILRWSPDGSHLLLLDPTLETLTIWDLARIAR